jgi:hypothetical protein
MNIAGTCTYETPCGWCTKWDKKCDKKIGREKSDESHKQLPIEDWYDWSTMSPMQRKDVLECIKIYNKWHETKINPPKDRDLIYIKQGLGLPPLNTDKTETPGIRKEN